MLAYPAGLVTRIVATAFSACLSAPPSAARILAAEGATASHQPVLFRLADGKPVKKRGEPRFHNRLPWPKGSDVS